MKKLYRQPDIQVITLQPRDGVLVSASNEGYFVDPVDPGFTPLLLMDDFNF